MTKYAGFAAICGAMVLGILLGANAFAQMGGGMTGGGMMGGYGPNGGGMMGGYGAGPGRGYNENGPQGGSNLNSRAGRAYAQTCSRCHALPDPRQHSAGQWPGVVGRMEGYMRQRGLPLPSANEVKDIDGFLQQHANAR